MLRQVQDAEVSLDGVSIAFLKEFAAECRRTRPDAETATTGDVCKAVIKPATEHAKCSFVELLKRTGRAQHVRRANLFVSHAWTYKFQLVVETLAGWCEREGLDAQACFVWFDVFASNQHARIADFAHWSAGFRLAIRSIGRAVLILQPWDDAVWLTRAWCLYEFWSIYAEYVPHEFLLPARDQAAFAAHLERGGRFEDVVRDVDIARAESEDKEAGWRIKEEAARNGGAAAFNGAVTAGLRAWFLASADKALLSIAPESERLASDLLLSVAEMKRGAGRLPEAEGMLARRWGELQRRMGGAGAQELPPLRAKAADTLRLLGEVCRQQGRLDAAARALGEALALQRSAAARPETPDAARAPANAGAAAGAEPGPRPGLAVEPLARALSGLRAALGDRHPETASAMRALGAARSRQGQHGLAVEHYSAALAVQRDVLGEGHPDPAWTLACLQEARRLHAQVRPPPPPHPRARRLLRPPARARSARTAAEASAALQTDN